MHGKGVKTWGNGQKYEGDWRDGKKLGKGVETLFDGGRKYDGEWKDGKRHGRGVMTCACSVQEMVRDERMAEQERIRPRKRQTG